MKNSSPSFIVSDYVDVSICSNVIKEFDDNFANSTFDKLRGYHRLNDKKFSKPLMNKYLAQLNKIFDKYKKEFPWCNKQLPLWSVLSPFNIQMFEPGDCYKPVHTEDGGPREGKLIRNLAFITYLNTINSGGETEFLYQKIKVRPEQGLTVIFPAGWTHPHFGNPATSETKYIITGWSSYHHRC